MDLGETGRSGSRPRTTTRGQDTVETGQVDRFCGLPPSLASALQPLLGDTSGTYVKRGGIFICPSRASNKVKIIRRKTKTKVNAHFPFLYRG